MGAAAAALALAGCSSSPTAPAGSASLTVLLKDAPAVGVTHAWVSVRQITLQGADSADASSGGVDLLGQPTGLIDLTELADSTVTLLSGQPVAAGTYSQVRFVVDGAVLETSDGQVYSMNGAAAPDGAGTTGDLNCPSCAQSGLKVNLPGGTLELAEGETIVTLDFSVEQSFGHVAGGSGMWVMHPVIQATTAASGPVASTGAIAGSVTVADSVALPTCDGAMRTVQDFVPTATASLGGSDSTRAGTVAADSSYVIGGLTGARWALGFRDRVGLSNGDTLVFAAAPGTDSVDVTAGDTATASFEILNATCRAASP